MNGGGRAGAADPDVIVFMQGCRCQKFECVAKNIKIAIEVAGEFERWRGAPTLNFLLKKAMP